jgi:hypothetical protein
VRSLVLITQGDLPGATRHSPKIGPRRAKAHADQAERDYAALKLAVCAGILEIELERRETRARGDEYHTDIAQALVRQTLSKRSAKPKPGESE